MSPYYTRGLAMRYALCAMLLSNQAHDQYPGQEKEEESGKKFNGRRPLLKEEGQLLRSHSPVDDSKNNQERKNKHKIIKEEVGNSAGPQGGRIDHEKDGRQVDLTGAGKLQNRDNKTGDNGRKEKTGGLTLFPYRLVDSLLQKIGELKLHLRGPSSLQENVVIEAIDPEDESEGKGDEIDDPREKREK